MSTTITPDSNHSGLTTLEFVSIYEDAGATAKVNFRKAGASGTIVFTLVFAANECINIEFFRPRTFEGGVYVEEVSGSITGVMDGD